MLKMVSRILGFVVALLAIAGYFVEGEHLFGTMNVDLALDILRTVLAIALLVVGFAKVSTSAIRGVLVIVGILYVGMGLVAFADRTLFGMLPTGLTTFDIVFHLVVGVGSLIVGLLPSRSRDDRDSTVRSQ